MNYIFVSKRTCFRMDPQGEVTRLLAAWGKGDPSALDQLIPMVYAELYRIARRVWNRHQLENTLQPTELINEAYLKFANAEISSYQDRCHFFAVACTAMRQILVNHAKSRLAAKRGEGRERIPLDEVERAADQESVEIVSLHEALEALQAIDPRKSKVVEMRYFGGLSVEETAEALGLSIGTVNRDWSLAKSWLIREMSRKA